MQDVMVVMETGRPLMSSVKQEGEATTTGRMDYTLPDLKLFPSVSAFRCFLFFLQIAREVRF